MFKRWVSPSTTCFCHLKKRHWFWERPTYCSERHLPQGGAMELSYQQRTLSIVPHAIGLLQRNHTWALVKCLFLITTFSPRNSPWEVHIISVTCYTGELKRRNHSWEEAQLVSEMMFLTPKWVSWLQPSTACFQKSLALLPDHLVSPNDEVRVIIHNRTQDIWMIKEGWTQSQHGSGPGAFQNRGLGKTGYWWGGVGRIHEGFSSPRRTPRLPALSSASSPGPPYSGLSSLEIFCFQSIFLAK